MTTGVSHHKCTPLQSLLEVTMQRGHHIRSTPTSRVVGNKNDLEQTVTKQTDPKKPPTEEELLEKAIDHIGMYQVFQFPDIPGVCSAAWTIETAIIIHQALTQDTSVEGRPSDIEERIKALRTLAREVAEYELSGADPAEDEKVKKFIDDTRAEMEKQESASSGRTDTGGMTTGASMLGNDTFAARGLAEIVWAILNGRLTAPSAASLALVTYAIRNMWKLVQVEDRLRLYSGPQASNRIVLFAALFCMLFEMGAAMSVFVLLKGHEQMKKFVENMTTNKATVSFFNVDRLLEIPFMQYKQRGSIWLADRKMTKDELIKK